MDRGPPRRSRSRPGRRSLSLPFGIAVAWLLARGDFSGKALLNGLVHLPLILPPVVTGYLLLLTFGRRGPIGALLDQSSASSSPSAGPARRSPAAVMAFPLLVRAIRLSIEAVDRRLEEAAGTLGAGRGLGLPHRHAAARSCPASSPA